MICEHCGKEFTSKRADARFDSDACRKAAARATTTVPLTDEMALRAAKAYEETSAPQTPPAPQKPTPEPPKSPVHQHWFGQPPHKPMYIDCLKKDCPHQDNPAPNWTPTCTKACCATTQSVPQAAGNYEDGTKMSPTDLAFEQLYPGYHNYDDRVFKRDCMLCGKFYETRLPLLKFCSPQCKSEVMVIIADPTKSKYKEKA